MTQERVQHLNMFGSEMWRRRISDVYNGKHYMWLFGLFISTIVKFQEKVRACVNLNRRLHLQFSLFEIAVALVPI